MTSNDRASGAGVRWWRPLGALALGALALGALALPARPATAQLLPMGPGPLSEAHSQYDGVSTCFNCHPTRGGKRDLSCLGCHQHQDLKRAVDGGHGLHATMRRPCVQCHTEHKGRDHEIVSWNDVGGRGGFRHELTGFDTRGIHQRTPCAACHRRLTPRGRRKFTGLTTTTCAGCHAKAHPALRPEIRASCAQCHAAGGPPARQLRPDLVQFDHARQAGYALAGGHRRATCGKCHERGRMIAQPKRRCVDCHKSPHGQNFARLQCTDCHDPTRRFKQVSFDHKPTQFQLAGRHRTLGCARCHKNRSRKPDRECESCHRERHRGRFAPLRCAQCHQNGSAVPTLFNHARRTRFALTARHAKVRCRACHPGRNKPFEFLKRTDVVLPDQGHLEINCRRCHTKTHGDQFAGKKCLQCHKESGSKQLAFDHGRDARFALTGFHLKAACAKCHPNGQYRTGKVACASCHQDQHRGQLGARCDRCHPTEQRFKETRVDHARIAGFPLEGRHQEVACAKCHPERRYKLGRPSCVDCHRAKDPHQGRLGPDCARCHFVEKQARKFAHETMTRFPRTGRHLTVRCESCHRPPPPGGPPQVGWTRALAPAPVDPRFPVMGRRCADCHADKHGGRFGTACASCHRGATFREVSATVHDTGAFRLEGVHANLRCGRCHQPRRQLWGLGPFCQECHRADDEHRNALGPRCGDCHGQVTWRPARFSHTATGFPLRGLHRTAPCRSCHGVGSFGGRPTDCEACHQRDAAAARDPLHTAELGRCDRCHSEIGFTPARVAHTAFPLIGQHRLVRCRNCHPTGSYAATPDTCEACHLALYLAPSTRPDHRAAGYSTACEDCHTPVSWSLARRRR